jgi:hypothetical protein
VQFSANEWRIPSQAVVIADASGTTYMAETFPYVKALTQSFVKAMPEGITRAKVSGKYGATLIGFGGKDRIVSPLAPFNRSALASKADSLRILGTFTVTVVKLRFATYSPRFRRPSRPRRASRRS